MLAAFFLSQSSALYLLIYGASLAFMLWIFLGKLLPIFRESARYIGRTWHILSLLMVLFMIAMMTWFVFPSHITDFSPAQAVGLPALVLVMFITYAVIFMCIRNTAVAGQARQMALQLELLTTQVQSQARVADEVRRARHDQWHHNLTLLKLAEEENTQEIARYLQGLIDNECSQSSTVWCENDTLNSILSVYSAKAEAAHIIHTDVLAQAD